MPMKLLVLGIAILCCTCIVVAKEVRSDFHAGFSRGYALALEHVERHVFDLGVSSFLELSTTLTPSFDEYDESDDITQRVRSHHRRHHTRGANPEPDLEDEFLAAYTKSVDSNLKNSPVSLAKDVKRNSIVTPNLQAAKRDLDFAVQGTTLLQQSGSDGDDTSAKLDQQSQRIKQLEQNYAHAQARLEKYEQQQSAMSAGLESTDSTGKTEFIKGYEGGFKVGYEAGWNMATADLKKRYGFPANTPANSTASTSTASPAATAAPAAAALPPATQGPPSSPTSMMPGGGGTSGSSSPAGLAPAAPPAAPATASHVNLFAMGQPEQASPDPFNSNNPFFAPEETKPMNEQINPTFNSQPSFEQSQNSFAQPQFAVPQQQAFAPSFSNGQGYGFAPQGYAQQSIPTSAQGFIPTQMFAQNSMQGFNGFAQQQQQPEPQGLPGKAFQFLSNIKNMIQEGKSTVDAVRQAFEGEPQPAQNQFGQPMQQFQMPQMQQMQMPQMQQMQMPQMQQMQMPQMQQFQPQMPGSYGIQNLVQTQAETIPPQTNSNSLLSTIASLLGGSNTPQPPTSENPALSNLAQLLATTTGTAKSALPKPVTVTPGQDSAALGLQEMQNMIQEGQQ